MYFALVFFAARLIRSLVTSDPLQVIISEMPQPDYILKLCHDIYNVREASDFILEEDLFAKLIFLFRSPGIWRFSAKDSVKLEILILRNAHQMDTLQNQRRLIALVRTANDRTIVFSSACTFDVFAKIFMLILSSYLVKRVHTHTMQIWPSFFVVVFRLHEILFSPRASLSITSCVEQSFN